MTKYTTIQSENAFRMPTDAPVMRRPSALVLALLLLMSAMLAPTAVSKTGDATCVGEETWIDDAGDASPDIGSLRVEETGANCERIIFTLAGDFPTDIGVADPRSGSNEEGTLVTVDLRDAGAGVDYTIEYRFVDESSPQTSTTDSVQLLRSIDGGTPESLTEGVDADGAGAGDDGTMVITVDKSVFGAIPGWNGVSLATHTGGDDASTNIVLFLNFGLDTDQDGIADPEELRHFGDLTTADGTSDTDGDGISDGDEISNGSDPNDRDDPVVQSGEAEQQQTGAHITVPDEDGAFGMLEGEQIEPGGAYGFTFTEPGFYAFQVHSEHIHHGNITVALRVNEDGPVEHIIMISADGITTEGAELDAIGEALSSGSLELLISKNDTVVFQNMDNEPHRVIPTPPDPVVDFAQLTVGQAKTYTLAAEVMAVALLILSIIGMRRWKS